MSRLWTAIPAALLSLALLAGCGGGDDGSDDASPEDGSGSPTATASDSTDGGSADGDADDILAAAQAAAQAAESVHLVGDFTDEEGSVQLDVRAAAGRGGTGTLTVDGAVAELTNVDGRLYVKAPADIWARGITDPAVLAQLADRWVIPSEEQALVLGFFPFFFEGDLESLFADFSPEGEASVGETGEFNGEPAVAIVDSADDSTFWISTEGEGYPLGTEGVPDGDVTLSEWNEPVELVAPADAVDLSVTP